MNSWAPCNSAKCLQFQPYTSLGWKFLSLVWNSSRQPGMRAANPAPLPTSCLASVLPKHLVFASHSFLHDEKERLDLEKPLPSGGHGDHGAEAVPSLPKLRAGLLCCYALSILSIIKGLSWCPSPVHLFCFLALETDSWWLNICPPVSQRAMHVRQLCPVGGVDLWASQLLLLQRKLQPVPALNIFCIFFSFPTTVFSCMSKEGCLAAFSWRLEWRKRRCRDGKDRMRSFIKNS